MIFKRRTREQKLREKLLREVARSLYQFDIPEADAWEIVGVDSMMDLVSPVSQTVQVTLRRRA